MTPIIKMPECDLCSQPSIISERDFIPWNYNGWCMEYASIDRKSYCWNCYPGKKGVDVDVDGRKFYWVGDRE